MLKQFWKGFKQGWRTEMAAPIETYGGALQRFKDMWLAKTRPDADHLVTWLWGLFTGPLLFVFLGERGWLFGVIWAIAHTYANMKYLRTTRVENEILRQFEDLQRMAREAKAEAEEIRTMLRQQGAHV